MFQLQQEETLFKQVSGAAKKLVLVLSTSTSMTGTRKEALECVSYIHFPVQFKNTDKVLVQALIDSESEVNTIHLSFTKQLGLPIQPTDIGAQKIDGTALDTHEMVVAAFSVVDKTNQVRFFKETFLVANVSLKVVPGILFFTLSGADIDFSSQKLWWRTYITKKVFPTTKHVNPVDKKEFAAVALDPEHETYVVHIASLSSTPFTSLGSTPLNIHPSWRP